MGATLEYGPVGDGLRSASGGQTRLFAESDWQVNVNWVFVELDFFDDCCSRRLLFSWPLTGVVGKAAASAIAADIMPWSPDLSDAASVHRLENEARALMETYITFNSSTVAKYIISSVVQIATSLGSVRSVDRHA